MSYRLLVLGFVCTCVLSACQKDASKPKQDPHAIFGKVYLDDKLINYGTISFIRDEDRPLKSPVYPDGTYNIRNAPEGEYKIVIVTGQAPRPAAGGASGSPPPSFTTIVLPEKYSSSATTDLKYQVKPGRHEFDIKLQSEKATPTKESPTKEPPAKDASKK